MASVIENAEERAPGPGDEPATGRAGEAVESPPLSADGELLASASAPPPADGARRKGLLLAAAPLVVAGGIGALDYLRHRFQTAQTFLPERYPNGIWQPETYGVRISDAWFETPDGSSLHGWWIPLRRARGTVLYCHGNAGNITSRLGVYRYMKRMRMNVFAFDYRGYGRSEGRPSERGVCEDARAAYDHLVNEIGETPERVLLFGHSLGGAIAIDCACHRPVAGLVVQSSFTNTREMARARFPGMPLHLIARNQFRSFDKVADLDMPKLFIHGTADETVPIELGRRLFEHAADPKEWYEVPHAGHNDVYRFGGMRYLWRITRFARGALRAARRSRAEAVDSPGAEGA